MSQLRTGGSHGTVPGPPRGRRLLLPSGGVRARVEAMRMAEVVGHPLAVVAMLLRLARDVILLYVDLARDSRVPARDKWMPIGLAAAYLASPVKLVPDRVPVLRRVDDLAVVGWAARRWLRSAGYAIIYDSWQGSDAGLALVLTVAGVDE